MNTLVVVRHGQTNSYGLTKVGEENIRQLTTRLAPLLFGTEIGVFSSYAQRCIDTAYIIGSGLGVAYSPTFLLGNELGNSGSAGEVIPWLRQFNQESVVLVTHLPFFRGVLPYVIQGISAITIDQMISFLIPEVRDALLFDFVNGEISDLMMD